MSEHRTMEQVMGESHTVSVHPQASPCAQTRQQPSDQGTPHSPRRSMIDAGVLVEDDCPIGYEVCDTRTMFSFGAVDPTLDLCLSDQALLTLAGVSNEAARAMLAARDVATVTGPDGLVAVVNGVGVARRSVPRRLHSLDSTTPRRRSIDHDDTPSTPGTIQLNVGVHVRGGGMEFTVTDETTSLDIEDMATSLILGFEDRALLTLAVLAAEAARAMLHARGRGGQSLGPPAT